jgi:hypothetical protein
MPQPKPFQGLSPLTRSDLLTRLLREPGPYEAQPKAIRIDAYECCWCNTLYQEEDDASSCCGVSEVEAYACAVCREVWRYDSGAEQCCADKPADREAECFVCSKNFGTSDGGWSDAAAHCLGRDLSPAQTHQIAQMVRLRDVPWVEAIEAVAGAANVEFSGVPAGHSSNHPAGGTSAGTQG